MSTDDLIQISEREKEINGFEPVVLTSRYSPYVCDGDKQAISIFKIEEIRKKKAGRDRQQFANQYASVDLSRRTASRYPQISEVFGTKTPEMRQELSQGFRSSRFKVVSQSDLFAVSSSQN